MSVILVLGRWRQEAHEFKVILSYTAIVGLHGICETLAQIPSHPKIKNPNNIKRISVAICSSSQEMGFFFFYV